MKKGPKLSQEERNQAQREYNRRYYAEHKRPLRQWLNRTDEQREKHRTSNRQWHQKYRAKNLQIMRAQSERIKDETLRHYSLSRIPCCNVCGIMDVDVLTIDHIDGGGNKHRRALGKISGINFYYWLRKNNYPEGYQVLCANCNLKKALKARRNGLVSKDRTQLKGQNLFDFCGVSTTHSQKVTEDT